MPQKQSKTFKTSAEFCSHAVSAAEKGSLVITPTARLARRLLHLYRLKQIDKKTQAWATPQIMSFNSLLYSWFENLWDSRQIISIYSSLYLWNESLNGMELPKGLDLSPSLYKQLQDTVEALEEMNLPVCGQQTDHLLADFRRKAAERFFEIAKQYGYITKPQMLKIIAGAVKNAAVSVPECIIFAWMPKTDVKYTENEFITELSRRSEVEIWSIESNIDLVDSITVFATPEQECRAVTVQVLNEWNKGKKNLGIIFLDTEYFSLLKEYFDELAGRQVPDFTKEIRYNLTFGTPLNEYPLFQNAILLLRLASEPDARNILLDWFCSPYIEKSLNNWEAAVRKALWEESNSGMSLSDYLNKLEYLGFPVKGIENLLTLQQAPAADWIKALKQIWKECSFPVFQGETRTTDALAQQHLDELIYNLEQSTGGITFNAAEILSWFAFLAEKITIALKTPETTGIQVIHIDQSQGLAFDHIWVVGLHGEVMPGSRKNWPFMDPEEAKKMPESSVEQKWNSAKNRLSEIFASAPEISLSRADSRGSNLPYLPCRIISDQQSSQNNLVVDMWNDPMPEFSRLQWLQMSVKGFEQEKYKTVSYTPKLKPCLSDQEWSVTQIADLFICPFRFMCLYLFGIKKLEDPEAGIDPRERGLVLHNILNRFVVYITDKLPHWYTDLKKSEELLSKIAEQQLNKQPDTVFWRAEKIRLLGDSGEKGILLEWLEQEAERTKHGKLRFKRTEAEFNNLQLETLRLKGRIDRIDYSNNHEYIIWDYKSGNIPKSGDVLNTLKAPQLPLYALAVQQGLVQGIIINKASLSVGYIQLKKAADVKLSLIKNKSTSIDWQQRMQGWLKTAEQRLYEPQNGVFNVLPFSEDKPVSFLRANNECKYCEFSNLCHIFD
jgi:ATP-dependent helicase/nuclease subunit B